MRMIGLALLAAIVVAPQAARADWRAETGVFRIGLVERGDGAASPERYEPFRAAVGAAIDMPVELLVLPSAPALIDAQTGGRVDYAVLSSLGYAAAQEMCACLVPLAAPRSVGGATGVRSVLVVDAARDGAGGLGSGPVGYGPEGSLTGDLAPRIAFVLDGVPLYEAGFDLVLQSSFEAARAAFLVGDLAGFFAWDYGVADASVALGGGLGAAMTAGAPARGAIVWRSGHIPFGPHAVRDGVPAQVRTALRDMLVALDAVSPDAYDAVSPSLGGGFAPVDHSDYALAMRLVRALAAPR